MPHIAGQSAATRLGVSAGIVVLTLACAPGAAAVAPAAPAAVAPAAPAAAPAAATAVQRPSTQPTATNDRIEAARTQLTEASNATAAAQAEVDRASGQVPEVQAALGAAQAAHRGAVATQRHAREALAAAEQEVAAGTERVAQAQALLDEQREHLAAMARSAYMGDGPNQTMSLVLGAEQPSEVVSAVEVRNRSGAANNRVLAELDAAKAALAQELAALRAAQERAAAQESAAVAAEEAAAVALVSATTTEQALQELLTQRRAALARAAESQTLVQQLYDRLVEEQRQLEEAIRNEMARRAAAEAARRAAAAEAQRAAAAAAAASLRASAPVTISAGGGYARSGQAAVDWGLSYVGAGAEYFSRCLNFVDDAFGAGGGRVGTAIEQWERAQAVGIANPGDRNPPVGAQVFWWTPHPARHAAIYAGGGMVLTTEASNGRVGLLPLDSMDSWGPYLGWAPPYYG